MNDPIYECARCHRATTGLEHVIRGESDNIVGGMLPQGWEFQAVFDGRAFRTLCPTCTAWLHATPPTPEQGWCARLDGRALEQTLCSIAGRNLHPIELVAVRSAAGRDLLQRLDLLAYQDAEAPTAPEAPAAAAPKEP